MLSILFPQSDQPVLLCSIEPTVQEHLQEDHERRSVLQIKKKNMIEDTLGDFNKTQGS